MSLNCRTFFFFGSNSNNFINCASASHDETIKLWNITTGKCLKTMRSPKLYEKMNIIGIKGLTEAQTMTLKALGAVAE